MLLNIVHTQDSICKNKLAPNVSSVKIERPWFRYCLCHNLQQEENRRWVICRSLWPEPLVQSAA